MPDNPSLTYSEALDYIAGLAPRGWRLGLDRMNELLRRAGLEFAVRGGSPRYIHVAGTNGKGSTTGFLQSLLVESGLRTGAFFSPYVFDPKERWQFGREVIDSNDLAALTAEMRPVAESLSETEFGGITEFEFKTALGFLYWKRKECEWVALEVGLGGRLDATNVVTPSVSTIVGIGLDHTSILGPDVATIAAEKAGIVKPGIPVIAGSMAPDALAAIELVSAERGCDVWRFGREIRLEPASARTFAVKTPARSHERLVPGIVGARQPHNMALAVAAIDASGLRPTDSQIVRGTRLACVPGRFQRVQYRGQTLILDGAHNEDASLALAETLEREYPGQRFTLLTGMVQGHDPRAFFAPLSHLVSQAYVAPIDFFRAQPVETVASGLEVNGIKVAVFGDLTSALDAAHGAGGPVLVTGSNYLLGDLAERLGFAHAKTPPFGTG